MIVVAFPTLGKTFYVNKYKKGVDADFAFFKKMLPYEKHEVVADMFFEMLVPLCERCDLVFTNTPFVKFPWDQDVYIVLPSYDSEEAKKRLEERGDYTEGGEDIVKNFDRYCSEWQARAEQSGYPIIWADTLEHALSTIR